MKKLLFKILKILFIVFFCVFIVFNMNVDSSYYREIIKKRDLLVKTKSPKIILVGGSNLAFGVDSDTLSNRFALPVVNMGLMGGFGLKFILEQTASHISPGDIVLISLEYEHFWSNPYGNFQLTSALIEDPSQIKYITVLHVPYILENLPRSIREKLSIYVYDFFYRNEILFQQKNIYSNSEFNEYGDMMAHYGMPPSHERVKVEIIPSDIPDKNIEILKKFLKKCNEVGARVFLIHPPTHEAFVWKNEENIGKLFNKLSINEIVYVSEIKEFIYKDEDFVDTKYHLNINAKNINTEKIIKAIKMKL